MAPNFFFGGGGAKKKFIEGGSKKKLFLGGPQKTHKTIIRKKKNPSFERHSISKHVGIDAVSSLPFLHFSLSFQHSYNLFAIVIKKNLITLAFTLKKTKKYHVLCVKNSSGTSQDWTGQDWDFTGVSSSEAPPYLLLWHFNENQNQNRQLFLRLLKTLKTKHAIVYKNRFLLFPW